jgi:steroid 5-alpha reductase family enzyme
MGWNYLGIFFIVAAVLCAVGFYKYVYFISIGYGFAVAGLGVTMLVLFHGQMQAIHYVQCLLFLAYGARLSGFLLYREIKNAAYRKTLSGATGSESAMPLPAKLGIWLGAAALYVTQVSPVFYRQYNGASDTLVPWIGAAVSAAALCIETLADQQKSAQKAVCPNMVATQGLYKFVRCPNYLGEILFWTGVTVGSLSALQGWGQWLMALVAYACIIFIMFNGAQRLEKRQNARYGALPEYRAYANSTPILLPFVPLYHLNKETVK